jgi:phosphate-selective porin OprO/OprP
VGRTAVPAIQSLRRTSTDCEGRGFGAWELAVRYSFIDLSNKAVQAGRLDSVTVGLNWYLNTNTKLQFNSDSASRGHTASAARGHVHGFGIRSAFDF